MTVRELIEKLQTMPPDTGVVYQSCSEDVNMELDQVYLVTSEEKKLALHMGMYISYSSVSARYWQPGQVPEFVTRCCFPGN